MDAEQLRNGAVNGHQTLNVNGRPRGGAALFARNFFSHPRMLGSIIPSSRFLVRRLLDEIDWSAAETIVEFGPGIGNISTEILSRLRPGGRLVALEMNASFVSFLRANIHDPRFTVAEASAENVRQVLKEQSLATCDHVVSGIPFSTMPSGVRDSVLAHTKAVLRPGGSMLVYQFSPSVKPALQQVFGGVRHEFELLNVLPAHLFFCRREVNGHSASSPV